MTYRIPLPSGGRRADLDIVDPNSTAVQRFLRRDGLAGYEPPTVATVLAVLELVREERSTCTFFDIGANVGLYALLAASMFDDVTVDAFEPTPSTVALLERAVAANHLDVTVKAVAVGDIDGTATLHYSAKSDASNSMVAGFKVSHSSIEVPTVRLDQYVRSTGRVPSVLKVDVETFEPQVLAGAANTIATARPYIVIEVLNRRGHDHGEEITACMEEFGYTYYELSAEPTWSPFPTVQGRVKSTNTDWLLAPRPLPVDFSNRWASWRRRLDECTPDRNGRVPLGLSVRAAFRRGGISEVIAAGRRYLVARRRERTRETKHSES